MDILNYFGKFHPLILHLPIGFLFLAFMMEMVDRWKKQNQFQTAIQFTLFWGMIGSIIAAGTGYLLASEGGYEAGLLQKHQWLGFGVAGLSILLYLLSKTKGGENKLYFPAFVATVALLTGAGHYGGSLTHGVDFLSPSASGKKEKKAIADIKSAHVYSDLVQPIFKEKCTRCHNASKVKGELLMTSIEGLKKGGETGALFVKGAATKSLMIERIHLPLEEEEHMPPEGKKQLTKDEIKILEWWINEGANFEAKVSDLKADEKMMAVLNKFATPTDGLLALKVAAVEEGTLQKLRNKGIPVFKIAQNSPFVEVNLSRKKGINKSLLKQLNPVAKQLISINLSNTDVKDEDLSVLQSFPHLQKIFLQQTAISDKGLTALKDLEYLEYLNLYQTKITDNSFPVLSEIKRLKKLFLWQSSATKEGVAQFVNTRPKTIVNTGIDKSIFGDARLKAPLIEADNDLFQDSIRVHLALNFKEVQIYYTTDGSEPDSTSTLYTDPFLITESSNVKAIAHKEGWKTSPVSSKQLVAIKYKPTKVTLSKKPSSKYAAKGSKSLIDFQKGSTTFSDGAWLGYEKEHFTATLDLGTVKPVSGVTIGALEATSSYIFFPKGMKVAISKDGKKYQEVIAKKYPTTKESKPTELANFTERFEMQDARFVKVTVESNLVNPSWHAAPGAPCWLFVDEISVE